MSAIYKPIGLVLGIVAGVLGRRLFDFAWTKIDDEDPPKGTTEQAPWGKIVAAAALQDLGLHRATDVVGGFTAWRAAGLPTAPGHDQRPDYARHDARP